MTKAALPHSNPDPIRLGDFILTALLVTVCLGVAVFFAMWLTFGEQDLLVRMLFGALATTFLSGAVACVVAARTKRTFKKHDDD